MGPPRAQGWRAANELLVTTASAVGIYGAADVLTQTLEQKQGPPRVRRGVVQTGVDISVRTIRAPRASLLSTLRLLTGASFAREREVGRALPAFL